jgi:hypothetical protein
MHGSATPRPVVSNGLISQWAVDALDETIVGVEGSPEYDVTGMMSGARFPVGCVIRISCLKLLTKRLRK